MFVTIFESPVSVAVEFTGRNTANSNKRTSGALGEIFPPRKADFGGKFSNVFIVFEISPKFGLSAWLLF